MIANLTNKKYIARNAFFALSFIDRMRGMIGRKFHEDGFDAMVFANCNSIHSLFMRQNIDVIFLDAENKVVGLRANLATWLPFVYCSKAVRTIELPSGVIEHSGTEIGHVINVSEESVGELVGQDDEKQIVSEMKSAVPFKESGK